MYHQLLPPRNYPKTYKSEDIKIRPSSLLRTLVKSRSQAKLHIFKPTSPRITSKSKKF